MFVNIHLNVRELLLRRARACPALSPELPGGAEHLRAGRGEQEQSLGQLVIRAKFRDNSRTRRELAGCLNDPE